MSLRDEIEFDAVFQEKTKDADNWEHNLWRVTLTFEGRKYTTDFRMGTGLCDYKEITPGNAATRRNRGEDVRWNHFGPGRDALATRKTPTRDDVLYSLSSDCQAGDQLFEDFCGDFGYDPDSRKAHAIWEECQKVHYDLRNLFGRARFQEFIDTDWEEQ